MYSRVYVEITNICNKNCSFCPKTKRTPIMMQKENFEHILSELEGVTKYIYYHLMGEPLLHKELPEFIKLASSRGFNSAVTTNGTILPTVGDTLIESGVYKVNISLHSFADLSEEEFEKYTLSCLDFAKKANDKGILTVLRLWNGDFDKERNEKALKMIKDAFGINAWHDSDRGARIRHRLHLEYGERFEWPSLSASDGGENVFCYGLSDHFGILSDGSVVPCCLDSDGLLTLGNIFDTPLSEILSSEKAQKIKDGFKNRKAVSELCRRCGYAKRFKV
ncbi:MAG: SPASM domain-containing protein [Clostridia bacterium]|nr:SPASM domain-containing protein [Clostridia bacterium]